MLTGLIYAAIMVLWAAVLLPQRLNRNDRHREQRSTRRFQRVLSTLDQRVVHMPRSRRRRTPDVSVPNAATGRVSDTPSLGSSDEIFHDDIDLHLDYGIDPFVGAPDDVVRSKARMDRDLRDLRAEAAHRRLVTTVSLAGATFAALIFAMSGHLPLAFPVLGLLATAAFLVLARRQVVRHSVLDRQRASLERLHRDMSQSVEAQPARRHIERSAQQRPQLTPEDIAAGRWLPTETLLPSYVNAPLAAPVPRKIDVTTPGSWTSARMLEQLDALRDPQVPDIEAELGLDEIVDIPPHRLRAANE